MRQLAIKNRSDKPPGDRNRSPAPSFSLLLDRPSPLLRKNNGCLCGGGGPRCKQQVPIQTKLAVSQPGDVYEQEADRVAEQVMRMPALVIQRKCASCTAGGKTCPECETEEKNFVQRKTTPGTRASGLSVSEDFLGDLGPGRPLDAESRAFFEPRFGHDFADVRVHTGDRAAESARSVGALAYTAGHDVVFASGQYAPASASGKSLLAHEIVHAIQQADGASVVQRACDPTLAPLAARTSPVFFPLEATIANVFTGAQTLTPSLTPKTAVGLVQQALLDVGFNLGTSGPNHDGVDRKFGTSTEAAITSFQTGEAIPGATPGVLDQPTLKCLDDKRSQLAVPPHQAATVTPADVQVGRQETGGRDEDLFFSRGLSTLNVNDKAKIGRLLTRAANPLKGCNITLEGFVSEDEQVEFGPGLATDRINAVDAELVAQHHDDPGPACPNPVAPLRAHSPLPAVSSGVSDYRSRRKVEVVPAGATSTTAPCPPGSAQFRALTAAEATTLSDAIDLAVAFMNTAIGKLTPGHAEGDPALTAYFGGTSRRTPIKTKLTTWRDHLDNVVRVNNRHGTPCDSVCRIAIAYNTGVGAAAQMTLCEPFFQPMTIHPALNQDEKKAFAVMHEAGHGSIRTRDTGYGHRRLIEFLAGFPAIAETNTDSFGLMVLCLNGFAGFCAAPTTTEPVIGLNATEAVTARRGLAWLQTWIDWAEQDTASLYSRMNAAREAGQGVRAVSGYYADVYDVLRAAFNIHRPQGDPPPTFSEQTTVAAIEDRILLMDEATAAGITVEKDTSAPPASLWMPGPGRHVWLADAYFLLATDRERVEFLLPLILEANSKISPVLEPVYETYIKQNVITNRGNRP